MLGRAFAAALFVSSLAACGGPEPQFRESRLPDLDRRPMHVSIVGLYQDGLLRADGWSDFGATLTQGLGTAGCEAFYSKSLDEGRPSLASSIDHVTRVVGVTDELLAALAPAAKGDTVLLLSIGAHPERSVTAVAAPRQIVGGNGRLRNAPRDEPRSFVVEGSVDLSATFFSVATKKPVAELAMTLPGDDVDAAMRRFGAELARRFPAAKCAGWTADAPLDEAAIEALTPKDAP